jgi:mRNA-degrading endonuclease RelE of RelBE toxin-antitoxin system
LRRGSAYARIYALYEIRFARSVTSDLQRLRANQRRRILDEIQRKLAEEPTKPTKHIKQLHRLVPPFEAVPPIWQLRVGDHRVFYDVDDHHKKVFVRAVRRKPPHLTTEQIL